MSAIGKLRGFKKFMRELFPLSVRQWIYSTAVAAVPLLSYIAWKEDNVSVMVIGVLDSMFATTIARMNTGKSTVITPDGTLHDTPSVPMAEKAVVEASENEPLETVKKDPSD